MDPLTSQNREEPPDAKSQPTTDQVAEQKYSAVVARYRKRVFGFLYRKLDNYDDAGELTQQTLKQAWKHWQKIQAAPELWPWLCTTANNLAIDFLRRQSNSAHSAKSIDSHDVVDSTQDPLVELTRAEVATIVRAAVDDLSEEHGFLIRSFYFEDMDIAELAVRSGKSLSATHSALYRARQALKLQLQRVPAISDSINLSASKSGGPS